MNQGAISMSVTVMVNARLPRHRSFVQKNLGNTASRGETFAIKLEKARTLAILRSAGQIGNTGGDVSDALA